MLFLMNLSHRVWYIRRAYSSVNLVAVFICRPFDLGLFCCCIAFIFHLRLNLICDDGAAWGPSPARQGLMKLGYVNNIVPRRHGYRNTSSVKFFCLFYFMALTMPCRPFIDFGGSIPVLNAQNKCRWVSVRLSGGSLINRRFRQRPDSNRDNIRANSLDLGQSSNAKSSDIHAANKCRLRSLRNHLFRRLFMPSALSKGMPVFIDNSKAPLIQWPTSESSGSCCLMDSCNRSTLSSIFDQRLFMIICAEFLTVVFTCQNIDTPKITKHLQPFSIKAYRDQTHMQPSL